MINQQKIEKWVELFLAHVKEITSEVHVAEEEGYKFKAVDTFQQNFDLEAENLKDMLDTAIVNNNLVAGSWYFPRKMLLIFSEESEQETREILRNLLDEKQDVLKRIDDAEKAFNELMARRNKKLKEESHSFIGIRFLSLLLGYAYSNKYNALKPKEWKVFCRYIDSDFKMPKHTSSGGQYEKFTPYIEKLREYIFTIPGIKDLQEQLTSGLGFKDSEFRWMAQNVIYVTSASISRGKIESIGADETEPITPAEEKEGEDEVESLTHGERFAFEEDLQHFIEDNFDSISFGGKLRIYTDPLGRQGLYYPTEYGEVDILALDVDDNYVVIELKRDKAADKTVNQIGRYMQWVEENLASKKGKSVRGIIVAHRGNKSLLGATNALRFPVEIKTYKLKVELTDMFSIK